MLFGLSLTPELTLPDDADARRTTVLGMSGSGKTSAGKVIVEHLAEAGRRLAIIDPAGVWWGLRTAADGTGPGLPFVVFGGRHADVPLEASAGAAVADLVMDENVPVILDLSGFEDDAEQCRVAADFIRRLRSRQHPGLEPLLLVVDEADVICPQNARKEEMDSQRQLRGVARRSRSDGLGLVTITQRPATLHKDVLGQAEAIILCRFVGYNDLDAVKDWLGSYLSPAQRDEAVRALPSLSEGECYVVSPSWMRCFQRVQFPMPQTFDSSATPRAGQKRAVTGSAPIDVSALATRFAAAIEREQENDPAQLKARIVELEREAARPRVPVLVAERIVETVEVPVLSEAQAQDFRQQVYDFIDVAKSLTELAGPLVDVAHGILAELRDYSNGSMQPSRSVLPEPVKNLEATSKPVLEAPALTSPAPPDLPTKPSNIGTSPAPAAAVGISLLAKDALPSGVRRILMALARCHQQTLTAAQLGTQSKLTPSGGTWTSYITQLRSDGLIEQPRSGTFRITARGLAHLGQSVPAQPMTTEDVLQLWRPALRSKEVQMLELLVRVHPQGLSQAVLATRLGLTAGAGTFGSYLGKLRQNDLVRVDKTGVFASDALFPG